MLMYRALYRVGLSVALGKILLCVSCIAGHPVVGHGALTAGQETDADSLVSILAALFAASPAPPGEPGSPEIHLLVSGGDLPSGSVCDFSGGGNCNPDPVTITILNLGGGDLVLAGVTVDNTSDFTLTPPAANLVPAFSAIDFQLDNTNSGCCITGILTVQSNDADESTYTVNLLGNNS
jgi:hypothetical protein